MANLTDFTFSVELATGSTPRTASPSYTAVTSYVMAGDTISLSRGRSSEQESTAQAGRANVTLRNTDNRFTMGNGSSPYAPLQLRRPCRFRVTYSGTTYDRWQGFVDDWGNRRDETTGVARLSLSDRLARAAKSDLRSWLVTEILSDSPVYYLPMGDASGSTSTSDAVDGSLVLTPKSSGASSQSSYTFGGTSGPGIDGETALTINGPGNAVDSYSFTGTTTKSLGSSVRTLEMYVNVPAAASMDQELVNMSWLRLAVDSAGRLNSSSGSSPAVGPSIVGRGWLHVMAVVTSVPATPSIDWIVYVDGVDHGSGSNFGVSSLGTDGDISIGFGLVGSVAHVAVHSSDLTARIDSRLSAATGWAPETTTARFNRLCASAALPSAFYATSGTTDTTMDPQPVAGKSLLSALTEVADVEGGTLFVSNTGVLTLATSDTRYNTSVGLTLDSTKAGQVVSDVELITNDATLINDSTASRPNGPTQRTYDSTSVTNYDKHDESATLLCALDTIALNWTQWRVGSYKTPAPRLESVTVNVVGYANSGGNVANLLNADIGTKLQITNLPSDVSSSGSLSLLVEGVRDEWAKDAYRITFTTSPIGLNDTVWKLGTSLLGVGTVLGY